MGKPWSFLIYIAADNPLYDDAQVNLRQIVDASRSAKIKILVQFDGPSSDFATRYQCLEGSKTVVWEAPNGYTQDRGDRLTDFLNFAIDRGFAGQQGPDDNRIFFVLWGHGAGLDHVYLYNEPPSSPTHPVQAPTAPSQTSDEAGGTKQNAAEGSDQPQAATHSFDLLNSDNAHANRYLTDMRLAGILGNFEGRLGHKIDVLGFDACLMGMAEICHEVASSVSLMVTSDEELPRGSWPYDSILGDLTRFPGMDPSTLSAVIVSRFIERYATGQKKTRVSLSTYNLSACDALAGAMTDFVKAMSAVAGDSVARRKILHARDFSRTADVADYVDLGAFCNEIKTSFKDGSTIGFWAGRVFELLMDFPYIIYHREGGENKAIDPFGLALYFPEVLPPTSADLSTAANAGTGLQTYQPLAPAGNNGAPSGLHTYRPTSQVQPMTVLEHTKTVLDHTKTVLEHTKTVLEHTKHLTGSTRRGAGGGRIVTRELVGSEVIWDLYIGLKFNQETHWADLISALITGKPQTDPAQ